MITDIDKLYQKVMGGRETGPRGSLTKELLSVNMQFPAHWWFFDYGIMLANEDYIRKELQWYIKGSKTDLSITEHAAIWSNCVDENGEIQSNYGFYYNAQIDKVLRELTDDPDSRRAVVHIFDNVHLYPDAPDVPCTLTMQFFVRQGLLHSMVNMRSQDAVFGLRNDIPAFQMFKLRTATALGYQPGELYLNVGSFHIYQRHWDKIIDSFGKRVYWHGCGDIEDMRKWLVRELRICAHG